MHLLLLFDASCFSFFCLCMHVRPWFSSGWSHSVHVSCHHPLSKVNKCMCTLVGCYHIPTLKGAKLPLHLNQRLKKIPKENQKKEKSPESSQVKNLKGKKSCVYWLVFCNTSDLSPSLHPCNHFPFCKQQALCLSEFFSFKGFQRCNF